MTALLFAAVVARPSAARADEDDAKHEIAIGQTIEGVFSSNVPVYHFRGRADDVVRITLAGKTADQIGVVLDRPGQIVGEWLTGNYVDDFAYSGNVRRGDTLTLTLRLPETGGYMIFYRDRMGSDEELPYTLSLSSLSGSSHRSVYVRGSIGAGGALVDVHPTYMFNATLSVGQRRSEKAGVEGVISASVIPANTFSVMGLAGIGLRSLNEDPITIRAAIGLAAMLGEHDQLGVGGRYDVMKGHFDWGFELARVGRGMVGTMFLGVAL